LSGYRLTVRHGSRVDRERFDDLDDALAALRRRAEEVRGEGPLDTVKAFRDYEPAKRVAARLELSSGGWLRGREAGVDVMGDGTLVPYEGGIRREPLEAGQGRSAFEAVRQALS
jgi:hypothetical protein